MDTLTTSAGLRTRMGRRSRVRAVERFSIAAAGSIFLSHYDATTGKPASSSVPAHSLA